MPGAESDITSTLSDLERKLQDLETELASVSDPAPAVVPDVAGAQPAAEAAAPLDGLYGQMAELERFRETLEASARSLIGEYHRLLEQVHGQPPASAPAPLPVPPVAFTPPPTPAIPPVPTVPAASPAPSGPPIGGGWAPTAPSGPPLPAPPTALPDPVLPPEPTPAPAPPPAAAPAPPVPASADPTLQGQLTVDAGPFSDIGTLSQFEQSLGRLPGAQDVYVKGFEGNRALIDLQLGSPIAIATQLGQVSPLRITVHEPVPGSNQLKVDVEGAPDA